MTTDPSGTNPADDFRDVIRSNALSAARLWEEMFERLAKLEEAQVQLQQMMARIAEAVPELTDARRPALADPSVPVLGAGQDAGTSAAEESETGVPAGAPSEPDAADGWGTFSTFAGSDDFAAPAFGAAAGGPHDAVDLLAGAGGAFGAASVPFGFDTATDDEETLSPADVHPRFGALPQGSGWTLPEAAASPAAQAPDDHAYEIPVEDLAGPAEDLRAFGIASWEPGEPGEQPATGPQPALRIDPTEFDFVQPRDAEAEPSDAVGATGAEPGWQQSSELLEDTAATEVPTPATQDVGTWAPAPTPPEDVAAADAGGAADAASWAPPPPAGFATVGMDEPSADDSRTWASPDLGASGDTGAGVEAENAPAMSAPPPPPPGFAGVTASATAADATAEAVKLAELEALGIPAPPNGYHLVSDGGGAPYHVVEPGPLVTDWSPEDFVTPPQWEPSVEPSAVAPGAGEAGTAGPAPAQSPFTVSGLVDETPAPTVEPGAPTPTPPPPPPGFAVTAAPAPASSGEPAAEVPPPAGPLAAAGAFSAAAEPPPSPPPTPPDHGSLMPPLDRVLGMATPPPPGFSPAAGPVLDGATVGPAATDPEPALPSFDAALRSSVGSFDDFDDLGTLPEPRSQHVQPPETEAPLPPLGSVSPQATAAETEPEVPAPPPGFSPADFDELGGDEPLGPGAEPAPATAESAQRGRHARPVTEDPQHPSPITPDFFARAGRRPRR